MLIFYSNFFSFPLQAIADDGYGDDVVNLDEHMDAYFNHTCYIREFQSNSNVLYLINCGNKSKCFCVFYKFYFSFHNTEYKEVVQVLTNLI